MMDKESGKVSQRVTFFCDEDQIEKTCTHIKRVAYGVCGERKKTSRSSP